MNFSIRQETAYEISILKFISFLYRNRLAWNKCQLWLDFIKKDLGGESMSIAKPSMAYKTNAEHAIYHSSRRRSCNHRELWFSAFSLFAFDREYLIFQYTLRVNKWQCNVWEGLAVLVYDPRFSPVKKNRQHDDFVDFYFCVFPEVFCCSRYICICQYVVYFFIFFDIRGYGTIKVNDNWITFIFLRTMEMMKDR